MHTNILSFRQKYTQTDTHAYRHTFLQTKHPDRQTGTLDTHGQTDKHTERQTVGQIYKPISKQKDRQTSLMT